MTSITNDEFNVILPTFKTIIEQYLSGDKLQILSTAIESWQGINDKSGLKLVITLGDYLVKMIFLFDDVFNVPILYVQQFITTGEFDELVPIYDDTLTNVPLNIDNLPFEPGNWMFIHPCETVATVHDFLRSGNDYRGDDRILHYIITWNAIYGTGIFPSLSLRYKVR